MLSVFGKNQRHRPTGQDGPSYAVNSPWTAEPGNWYILTCLTDSLYLGWFTGHRPKLPQKWQLAALSGLDTILAGNSSSASQYNCLEHTVC